MTDSAKSEPKSGKTQIEITPEMFDAGFVVIWSELCGALLPLGFSPGRLAEMVFTAMERARRSSR